MSAKDPTRNMMRGVFTIPATSAFLPAMAAGILSRVEESNRPLTEWRILLPTRRAGRELRDAFQNLSGDKPLLLPRLQSIGDVDADELGLHLAGFGVDTPDIPDAIPNLERLFLLAELTRRKDAGLSVDQSLVLARGLARLIDQTHTEDLTFDRLSEIVPSTLSTHWQDTLSFLEIVTQFWPAILAERGLIDPADRRNRLMKSLIDFWSAHPPQTPILAAGSTGSIPTTAKMLGTIAGLPQGMVILPALDTEMDEVVWDNITATHPQATMKNLLQTMGVARDNVQQWTPPLSAESGASASRRHIIRAMMAPAADFGKDKTIDIAGGMDGVTIVEAANPQEEAATIAVALRAVLQHPTKTACFVTPDRMLARRVMTALARWGIDVDDSAGGALAVTPSATFFGALLRVVEDGFAPLSLLTFLKHPLSRFRGSDVLKEFELDILRGSRPAAGLQGLRRRLDALTDKPYHDAMAQLLSGIETDLAPLVALAEGAHPATDFTDAVITAAQNAAGGEAVLWAQSESESLATFLSNVMDAAAHLPPLTLSLFVDVFHELLSPESFRETDPRHRRILFLGQLESRLVRRDVMVLGGLNEGTWPADPGFDPWMSRPMRRDFGLPTAERGIGLAAHDFASHLSAVEVIVTRSLKADGTATVPARWLQRLKALMAAAGHPQEWSEGPLLDWARALDIPQHDFAPIAVPAPCPPRDVRPQQLSVTAIEKWMNNPYRIYAERILKLYPLAPIDEDVTHAERGSFVHDILSNFVKDYSGEIPANAKDILLEMGRTKFAELESLSPQWHYWWPRFERIVDWFLGAEGAWRRDATPWKQETSARLVIHRSTTAERQFTVTAKADRIDRMKLDGAAFIIDYKTGAPPSWTKVKNGQAPQLPLEGLIAREGGWGDTPMDVAGFAYWRMNGAFSGAGEVKVPSSKTLDFIDTVAAAETGLRNLVIKFEDANTPYMAVPPKGARVYDDEKEFAHLARTSEWASETEDDDAEEDSAA